MSRKKIDDKKRIGFGSVARFGTDMVYSCFECGAFVVATENHAKWHLKQSGVQA